MTDKKMLTSDKKTVSVKKPMIAREIKWFLAFWISVILLLALVAFFVDMSHQQAL